MAALTLGTGAFVWLNAGPDRPEPPEGVLATVAWQTAGEGRTYAFEAFCANAGNALGVLRGSGLVAPDWRGSPPDWERPHPIVVPAPAGLGTPHWHDADRVTMVGATSATTAADIAAAWLAGVAHQITDALEALDAAHSADVLRMGGGLAADRALVQAVADLSGLALEVSADLEATARGIATLAATSAGVLEPGAAGHSVAAPRRAGPGCRRPGARAGPLAARPRGARAASGRGVSRGSTRSRRPRRVRSSACAARCSTSSWSAAASPAPASPWTRPPAGSRWRSWRRATSPRARPAARAS